MFDYTVSTNERVEDAVNNLENSLKEEQFGVLWSFDIKDKLQEKGLDFKKEYRVLEVCNPEEAQRVITENQMTGYFLPCKIVVYDDDGTTKIGMPKPTALINMINDDAVHALAKDIEERLITCIDRSV
ncbi:DUF302 domain-containing protein [Halobacillus sp. Marseille-P3879]|uniref:DUF302 domain-containing protein n=1 Tax=Halobacillus sp. Marseille-P3879 TaxID=2045014 RepID=UPI000C7A7B9B|nr:DUF302 domain-containing protein [Halobacillus sp. Marseille-P3879]